MMHVCVHHCKKFLKISSSCTNFKSDFVQFPDDFSVSGTLCKKAGGTVSCRRPAKKSLYNFTKTCYNDNRTRQRKGELAMTRKQISLLLSSLLLLTGCGKKPAAAPAVTTTQPEYSLVIEDTPTPPIRPVETLLTETTTAAETTTAEPETTAILRETTTAYEAPPLTETGTLTAEATIDKDGVYTTKEDVALYIYTYGELPRNFITKKQAQKLGWEGGSLEPYAPGCCIGGSYFGNYEGSLPAAEGREYTECDIDTLGKKSRGAKRIVFSNDGLIYYTEDHYKTFELLYGEE